MTKSHILLPTPTPAPNTASKDGPTQIDNAATLLDANYYRLIVASLRETRDEEICALTSLPPNPETMLKENRDAELSRIRDDSEKAIAEIQERVRREIESVEEMFQYGLKGVVEKRERRGKLEERVKLLNRNIKNAEMREKLEEAIEAGDEDDVRVGVL